MFSPPSNKINCCPVESISMFKSEDQHIPTCCRPMRIILAWKNVYMLQTCPLAQHSSLLTAAGDSLFEVTWENVGARQRFFTYQPGTHPDPDISTEYQDRLTYEIGQCCLSCPWCTIWLSTTRRLTKYVGYCRILFKTSSRFLKCWFPEESEKAQPYQHFKT